MSGPDATPVKAKSGQRNVVASRLLQIQHTAGKVLLTGVNRRLADGRRPVAWGFPEGSDQAPVPAPAH